MVPVDSTGNWRPPGVALFVPQPHPVQDDFSTMASSTSGDVDISKIDLYEFLGLAGPQVTTKEINKAGRQTSFRYHPDKVAATSDNLEKFHIAQIAIGVLSDPAEKTKYDQQREAKLRRKAEVDALDARRRKMADDLEARETAGAGTNVVAGQKRTFSEREMKIRRAQEENRRKIEERNTAIKMAAEQKAAQDRAQAAKEANGVDISARNTIPDAGHPPETQNEAQSGKTSMDRSIKLRWVREGEGQAYDEGTIREILGDNVEEVILLKDKKRKVEGRKLTMGTAVVIFTTITVAKQAMTQKGRLADKFESVEWMKGENEAER